MPPTPNFSDLFARLANARRQASVSPAAYVTAWQQLFGDLASGKVTLPDELLQRLADSCQMPVANVCTSLQSSFRGLAQPIAAPDPVRHPAPVAIVAAGNIPGVAVAPALLLAAAGFPVIVKMARSDRELLPWLLQAIQPALPGESSAIIAGDWPAESDACQCLLTTAEHVIAFGNDKTITKLERDYYGKVTGFGHKFSVGYVDSTKLLQRHSAALAEDCLLYSQQGCLSVQAIFVRGSLKEVRRAAPKFANRLAARAAEIGTGRAQTTRKLAALEWFDLNDKLYFAAPDNRTVVAVQEHFSPELLVGDGFVQIIPIEHWRRLPAHLDKVLHWLQGLAAAMPDDESFDDLLTPCHMLGFSRLCKPGELQAPPLNWANNGIDLVQHLQKR